MRERLVGPLLIIRPGPLADADPGLAVSTATVYRILRREGLVKRAELRLLAGKEYRHKTTGPHQLWATDAS